MSSSGVDVSSIDWDTVLEYNLANAFAVPSSEVENDTFTKHKSVNTETYSQSTGLLDSLSEKLETLKSNLQYMQNYSIEGDSAKNDKERETAYAQLRSLSAGIDSVVSSFKMEGLSLFSGRDYELSYDYGQTLGVSLDNMSSSDDGDDTTKDTGLNLAKSSEGAFVNVTYGYLNSIRNSLVSIAGLDITEAYTSKGDETVQQLTDGDYQIEVEYNGPKSTVYIQNLDGSVLDKLENVDLSGSGQMDLAFDCGVTLSIEKTSWELATGIDKYDYEKNGPVSLYADLSYESNVQHNLDDGTDTEYSTTNSVSIARGSKLKGTTGTLKVAASVAGVADGRTEMTTGQYNVKLQYDGDNGSRSSIWLYDQNGSLVTTARGIDLSTGKDVSVDLGTGVAISLDPDNFTSSDRTYDSYINYTAKEEAYEVFDFDAYYDLIQEALTTVQENIDVVAQAQEELESRYSTIQSAVDLAATSGGSASSDLVTLLSGGSDSGISADSLFSSINASSSSSSSSSSSTISLSGGDIIGALDDAVTSLSDVDASVLALYYK